MQLVRKFVVLTAAGLILAGCQTNQVISQQPVPVSGPDEQPQAQRQALNPTPSSDTQQQEQPQTSTDLWQLTRQHMQLDLDHDDPRLQAQFEWYQKHPQYMQRVATRASRYYYYILGEVLKRDMPAEVALLPIVESAYDPFAYSHGRAAGPWQFIPGTAKHFGLKSSWWYDGRRDIVASTDAALTYLQQLHDRFDSWELALAAYNCGGGNVSKAIRRNKKKGLATDFWSLDLPKETRVYVPKLLAVSKLIRDAEDNNLTLQPLPNKPVFEQVELNSQIDLAQAAKLSSISTQELYQLNPGFNRWATDPDGPHRLLIPADTAEQFRTQLAQLPAEQRVNWARHKISKGETISTIARHYNTTSAVIREANKLSGSNIRAGKYLLIPSAKHESSEYSLSQSQRFSRKQNQLAQSDRNRVSYEVKQGDSFWKIAKNNNVSVRELASWNQMAPGDPLRVGQTLAIWKADAHQGLSRSDQQLIRRIGYSVRSGDSLYTIADRFRVSINDIQRWNKLEKSKYLQPGQHLTLYVDITEAR
ncbi:LysM peptidoglycan-binding domain-containing protein [Amphritea sp. ZJ14W]|uniref:LysM peptidoglycan-binding domain-containing protein n=2 Tax=Amphritea pacifica TaxID=2811233 RepID=A0ABS2W653_9GAMM|nr:LysM peptidoglycan-binding domain-containing protein [Amphritea pacifica]MBN0987116.1 LysM peptidoglycan-binding domain-containing protein [Amphritea pacifica]MBN1007878.1 LysM peptidoglycan-binding domain-containing protein [Amphritea pacifica]